MLSWSWDFLYLVTFKLARMTGMKGRKCIWPNVFFILKPFQSLSYLLLSLLSFLSFFTFFLKSPPTCAIEAKCRDSVYHILLFCVDPAFIRHTGCAVDYKSLKSQICTNNFATYHDDRPPISHHNCLCKSSL